MNSKKYSVVDATLTSAYSIVYRNDKGMRIVNSDNVTVFTIWDRNPITILTASDYVRNDIFKIFPEAVYKYTNNYGNNHHLFRISNINVDEVLDRCFNSHSGEYDKSKRDKTTSDNKSNNMSLAPSPETVNERNNLEKEIQNRDLIGEEKKAFVKIRINQGEYRKQLLKLYDHCCLCKVSDTRLLIASHIKPWADSNEMEKVDPYNGLLLCPNHDKLFDQGLITVNSDKSITISSGLSQTDRVFMNISDDMKVECEDGCIEYFKYHRDNLFIDI